MSRVVVTGAAGFIGSHLTRMLAQEQAEVVAVDALTYAGNLGNLADVLDKIRFIKGDVRDANTVDQALAGACAVFHLAAESHVDRSIAEGRAFVETNVLGTHVVLDAALRAGVQRFVQVSTDEVYGTLGPVGVFTEDAPLSPRSPYAASKAAADLIALAYHHTHGLPVIVTRCTNNYGPYQFPEKLIPLAIVRALLGRPVPVYGDGTNIRDWIHVEDHCRGLVCALRHGIPGRAYNLGASQERTNIELVRGILMRLGVSQDLIRFVKDRPGHDFRYALDHGRAEAELGWRPRWGLDDGLDATVAWYQEHRQWWSALLGPEYGGFIRAQYGQPVGDGR